MSDLTLFYAFEAMHTHLRTLTTNPSTGIVMENGPNGEDDIPALPYLDPQIVTTPPPSNSSQNNIQDGLEYESGFLQVSIVFPRASGVGTWLKVAGQIKGHFPVGLVFSENGVVTKVTNPAKIINAVYDDDQARIPVQIPFVAT